jgi:regulatory protein
LNRAEPCSRATLEACALRHLARREYARAELRRLLQRTCADPAVVDAVLDELEAQALLSDLRFGQARLRSTCQRGFGPWRLRHDLQRAGGNMLNKKRKKKKKINDKKDKRVKKKRKIKIK